MAQENFHGPGEMRPPDVRHTAAGVDGIRVFAIPDKILDGNAFVAQKFGKARSMSWTAIRLGHVLETIEQVIENEIVRLAQPWHNVFRRLTGEADAMVAFSIHMKELATDRYELGLDVDDVDGRTLVVDSQA